MRGWERALWATSIVLAAVGGTAAAQDAPIDADAGVAAAPDAGVAAPPDAGVPQADAGEDPDGEPAAHPAAGETDPGPGVPDAPTPSAPQPSPRPVPEEAAPPTATAAGPGGAMGETPPAWATPAPEPQVLPLRFAARPLTLPRGAVRIDATFGITSQERATLERQTYVSFRGVAAFGATDDIEIGVLALPLQISPEPLFLDPGIYGLFRIVQSERLDLGLQVEGTVPVREDSAFGNGLSVRALWRAASFLRIDAAVTLVALYQDPVETSLRIPVVASFHLSETLFLGVQSGLDVEYLSGADERAGRRQNAFIPFGVFLGGTLVGDRGPSGDLRIGVFLPSVTDGFELWQLGFGGSFYIL